MNPKQQTGLVIVVLALLIGVWTIIRLTGVVGQMHNWNSSVDEFQLHTITGGVVAFLLLLLGVLMVGAEKETSKRSE